MGKKPPPAEDQPTTIASLDETTGRAEFGYRDALVRTLIEAALPQAEAATLRLEDVLDDGGVGSVVTAFDPSLQRKVAIKALHKQSYAEPMLVRGFLREARIIAQLEHPNIIAVHRLDDSPDLGVHFSMGLVEGRNLSEILAAQANPTYEAMLELLRILLRVCEAVEFAHSRGVIHCDIKPANIMVGEFGRVYLMDWGGAQLLDESTSQPAGGERVSDNLPQLPDEETHDRVFGTPAYMPPEQARGERIDERTDVFAIGAIIYRFLTGRAPFDAESLSISLKKAQQFEYEPLDEHAHSGVIPDKLYTIAERAISPDPEDRYPGVGALRDDLQLVLRGGGSFPTVRFEPGQTIIREGDRGDAGYIVVRGEVGIFRLIDGEQVELARLGPGQVFGETAIFAETRRTASIVAHNEVTVVRIDGEVIQAELRAMKPWMASFVRMLAERFKESESLRLKGE